MGFCTKDQDRDGYITKLDIGRMPPGFREMDDNYQEDGEAPNIMGVEGIGRVARKVYPEDV